MIVDFQALQSNIERLTNQLWKLIPMRENGEDWLRQAETVLIEVAGLNGISVTNPQLLELICKLKGLCLEETTFEIYRKTVFEMISLLQDFKNGQRL